MKKEEHAKNAQILSKYPYKEHVFQLKFNFPASAVIPKSQKKSS